MTITNRKPTKLAKTVIPIRGMHCASCVGRVERAMADVEGVADAQVSLATSDATIEYDPEQTKLDEVVNAVERSGYSAHLPDDQAEGGVHGDFWIELETQVKQWRRRVWIGVILIVCLLIASSLPTIARFVLPTVLDWIQVGISIQFTSTLRFIIDLTRPAQLLIGSLLFLYVGAPFLAGALRQLRHLNLNMDTLIALGITVAYGHGVYQVLLGMPGTIVFLDVGMIAVFVSFGRYLELKARRQASGAIQRLLSLTPPVATIIDDGQHIPRPIADIHPGQTILIRPGERIPLDATVLTGTSKTDESWLTGESRRRVKTGGDQIYAGSLNIDGALTAKVLAGSNDSYLARIVELVRQAQCSKANVERFADRAAFWFVPVVLVIAIVTLVVWGLIAGDWTMGITSAVAVTVVSCPCALGLATPTAIMAACQRGAQDGILIKDAQALETAGRLSCVLLDKTGTVTHGVATVLRADPVNGATADQTNDWLRLAAGAEQQSNHPLAVAIVAHAQEIGIELPTAESLQAILGEGVQAVVEGRTVLVGNERLLRRFHVPISTAAETTNKRSPNKTVQIAIDGQHLGQLTLSSTTDPQGKTSIARLRKLGLVTMIVSGDETAITEEVGQEIGVDQVHSELKPDDKYNLVKKMQATGHVVAMVGDGINDAPALVAADLGIAIGSGADVALESADIVLTRPDFKHVVTTVQLARATLRTIRQNLVWAVVYNICLIPLAAGVFVPLTRFVPWFWLMFGKLSLPPSLAAGAMAASSLSVVLNSFRLANRRDF
jgi:Cu+-exporting ATPase